MPYTGSLLCVWSEKIIFFYANDNGLKGRTAKLAFDAMNKWVIFDIFLSIFQNFFLQSMFDFE